MAPWRIIDVNLYKTSLLKRNRFLIISWRVWFQSLPEHRLPSPKLFVILLSPSWQALRYYLKINPHSVSSILDKVKRFCVLHKVQTGSAAQRECYPVVMGGPSSGVISNGHVKACKTTPTSDIPSRRCARKNDHKSFNFSFAYVSSCLMYH
jgi:hypothetical protein